MRERCWKNYDSSWLLTYMFFLRVRRKENEFQSEWHCVPFNNLYCIQSDTEMHGWWAKLSLRTLPIHALPTAYPGVYNSYATPTRKKQRLATPRIWQRRTAQLQKEAYAWTLKKLRLSIFFCQSIYKWQMSIVGISNFILHLVYSHCSVRERIVLKTQILQPFSVALVDRNDSSMYQPFLYILMRRILRRWFKLLQSLKRKKIICNSWSRLRRSRDDVPIALWIPWP